MRARLNTLPLGGPPVTIINKVCVTCPHTNWAIHSLSGTELGASIQSGLNQATQPSPARCPCATDRTQAITRGQPLPAKEPKTATPQGSDSLWVGSATAAPVEREH